MILTFRPATQEDVEWIAPRLREEDSKEIWTSTGRSPEVIMPVSFAISSECYTIRLAKDGKVEQRPAVLCGVADDPVRYGVGVMWLVATPDIRRGALSLLREAPHWLDHWQHHLYPGGLHNNVDSRNDQHVRWLRYLGFECDQTVDINGVPFYHMQRLKRES